LDAGRGRQLSSRGAIGVALIVLSIALVFGRTAGFEFVLYDDDKYLTDNPAVFEGLTPDSLVWALTSFHEGTYQPVTWLSYLADISLFGLDPGPMHLVNVVLHLLATLLLWRFLARATGRKEAAFVVAMLFALHPLQVQSVAWIAERKGLLAAVFGLAALNFWIADGRRARILAHLFFAISILAKPVWLPLPFVLFLLDRWPGRRAIDFRNKAGMIVIAVAGAVLAAVAQNSAAALSTLEEVGLGPRLVNAMLAWGATLRRLVAPFDLGAFYPFRFDHPVWLAIVWAVLIAAGSLAAWRLRHRHPVWFTGWFWWLILQAPTVGLLQFGAQGTADRFSYLPLAGLLVMLVYGLDFLRGPTARIVALVAIVSAGAMSARAVEPWRNTVDLLEHSIRRSGGSALEHQNLCKAYIERNEVMLAMRHSSRALHFAPHTPSVVFQQADLLFALGNYSEAMERYREGLRLSPRWHQAWAQVARLYVLSEEWEMAGRAWLTALDLDKNNVVYVLGLAGAMREQGLEEEQLVLYQRALEIDPSLPGVRSELGWIHATSGDQGLRDPEVALRLAETDLRMTDGESARALEVEAAARAALGDLDEAVRISVAAEEKALDMSQWELAAQIRERRPIYLP
jgi:tetratricopeptide (TPR) repeat protein